ncbi:hypothetical protein SD81_000675 [Tolypothrix campylonemoides VB511288]|nr:hypothetical protein SD81_000675 [Tolypothrix campylonemoides VB511288]
MPGFELIKGEAVAVGDRFPCFNDCHYLQLSGLESIQTVFICFVDSKHEKKGVEMQSKFSKKNGFNSCPLSTPESYLSPLNYAVSWQSILRTYTNFSLSDSCKERSHSERLNKSRLITQL